MSSVDDPLPTTLFAYGTLLPGDVRWPLLRRFVTDEGWPDRVAGRLFDTGLGYPAAIFGSGSLIHGRTFTLLTASLEQALEVLDREEDTVSGMYRRVTVTTESRTVAWAYAYGDGLELTPIESGDWHRHRTGR